ncbi:31009_t:CDS:2, partial [Racocetra persica]
IMTTSASFSIKRKRIHNTIINCKRCGFKRRHKDTNASYCIYCDLLLQMPSSDNILIDDFIKKTFTVPGVSNRYKRLQFAPFDQFINIKYLAEGGFSKIYRGIWKDGPFTSWYSKKKRFHRHKNCSIVLKSLKNSKHISTDFFNELEIYNKCVNSTRYDGEHIIKFFGMTQDPQTGNFMIITEFVKNGDLHNFLMKNINTLSWLKRLEILKSDFGISMPANGLSDNSEIYGIIPYIAPEVFKNGRFTTASDVYSLGMIIWELTSGYRPFSDRVHDEDLILDILNGLRPKIIDNTPQLFIDLMMTCWNADQSKRPTTDKLLSHICNALYENKFNFLEIPRFELFQKINSQSIYTSRPLSFLIKTALILQKKQSNSLDNVTGMKII